MKITKNIFRSGETQKTRARIPKSYPLIDKAVIRSSRAFTGACNWTVDQPLVVFGSFAIFGWSIFKAIPFFSF